MTLFIDMINDILKDFQTHKFNMPIIRKIRKILKNENSDLDIIEAIKQLHELNIKRNINIKNRLLSFFDVYKNYIKLSQIPNDDGQWQINEEYQSALSQRFSYAVWRYRETSHKRNHDIDQLMKILQSETSELDKISQIQHLLLSMKTGLAGRSKLRNFCMRIMDNHEPIVIQIENAHVDITSDYELLKESYNLLQNQHNETLQENIKTIHLLQNEIEELKNQHSQKQSYQIELKRKESEITRLNRMIAELESLIPKIDASFNKAAHSLKIFIGPSTVSERKDARSIYWDKKNDTIRQDALNFLSLEFLRSNAISIAEVSDDEDLGPAPLPPITVAPAPPPPPPPPLIAPKTQLKSEKSTNNSSPISTHDELIKTIQKKANERNGKNSTINWSLFHPEKKLEKETSMLHKGMENMEKKLTQ